jgi:transcriptional antiterminator RfaH
MEVYAANMLKSKQEVFVFLPQGKILSRKNEFKCVPFFPGYFFIQVDPHIISPNSVNTTPGVLRLITFGEELNSIPHSVVADLYKRISDFNQEGGLLNRTIQYGDCVRIKDGPLRELDVIFLGVNTPDDRARVLINILGRLKEVMVDFDRLERAPGKRIRFTRGRGRKLKNHEAFTVTDPSGISSSLSHL